MLMKCMFLDPFILKAILITTKENMKSVELDSILHKHICRWDRSIHKYPGEQEKHTNSPWMIILNDLPQMPSWEPCNNRGMSPICELTKLTIILKSALVISHECRDYLYFKLWSGAGSLSASF